MIVTTTEFKTNIGKYISLSDEEEIVITNNGKSVAKLTSTRDSKLSALHSMRGILKTADVTLENIRAERLTKYDESSD
ncbi:MAG: type II toxin-antitoxin system Phd/YefM family antitoxin [Synergistaceae bacterium]|nr:type II toxin-antitoxin system Phd/YefM family antitoxin [Synergistaceae bacterium]